MRDGMKDHWFGLKPPRGTRYGRAWGARAIYSLGWAHNVNQHVARVETLGDRQSYSRFDRDQEADQAFLKWLNEVALAEIKRELEEHLVEPDADEVVEFHDGRRHILANPRRSFGYLDIGAWEDAD